MERQAIQLVETLPRRSLALAYGLSPGTCRCMAVPDSLLQPQEPAEAALVLSRFNELYPLWSVYRSRQVAGAQVPAVR